MSLVDNEVTLAELAFLCEFTKESIQSILAAENRHFTPQQNILYWLTAQFESTQATTPIRMGFEPRCAGQICALQEHEGLLGACESWVLSRPVKSIIFSKPDA